MKIFWYCTMQELHLCSLQRLSTKGDCKLTILQNKVANVYVAHF